MSLRTYVNDGGWLTYWRETVEGITVQHISRTADHKLAAGLGERRQRVQTRDVVDETYVEHLQVVLEEGRDRGL